MGDNGVLVVRPRRVVGLANLRKLPVGFRDRWESRSLTRADISALRLIGFRRPSEITGVRSERRQSIRPTTRYVHRPTSRESAQLLAYFRHQDYMRPFFDWPVDIQKIAIKPHKFDNQRFRFMIFLIGNGLDPVRAIEWTLAGGTRIQDSVRVLTPGSYDYAAVHNTDRIATQASNPDFMRKYYPPMNK